MESIGLSSDSLLPQTWSTWSGENLNVFANYLKGFAWKVEQNLHHLFVPLTPERLGNDQSKAWEISKRLLFGVCAAIAAIPASWALIRGHLLTGVSSQLYNREYTYWRGKAQPESREKETFLHWNVCMLPGSLPNMLGGMRTAGERLEEVFQLIRLQNPDIFFLCEYSQTLSGYLYEAFKDNYAHFFVNIGPNALWMDANMAVVSRVPLISLPQFIPFTIQAEGDQKSAYRGYFFVETQYLNYLYVHLYPKDTARAKQIRLEQIGEINTYIDDHKSEKPWIVLGDFNIERGTEDHEEIKKKNFRDLIQEQQGNFETCIGDLLEERTKSESIDAILLRGDATISTNIIETYDKEKPYMALSDHKIIVGELNKND